MIGDIVKEAKLQPLQSIYKGLECDTYAEICIMAGDFNYRMVGPHDNQTACQKFDAMLKANDFKQYFKDWKNSDELHLAMREKRYSD